MTWVEQLNVVALINEEVLENSDLSKLIVIVVNVQLYALHLDLLLELLNGFVAAHSLDHRYVIMF